MASDPLERVRIVDRAIGSSDPAETVALLERLMDHTPGGNLDDLRALRIAVVARFGFFKSNPRAVARLVSELDAGMSREERLAAIDALGRDGNVPPQARNRLERIATQERDDEVRRRAGLALGRPGG